MKKNNLIVKEEDEAPARPDGTCFYCKQKIGEEHLENCYKRERSVVVEFTIRVVTKEPEHWTPDDIEFHYNESSWCADNLLNSLVRRQKSNPDWCLCQFTKAKYIKEASEIDEEEFDVFV